MKVKCCGALFEKIDIGCSFENIFKKHFTGIILSAGFIHFYNKKTALKLLCKLTSVVDSPPSLFSSVMMNSLLLDIVYLLKLDLLIFIYIFTVLLSNFPTMELTMPYVRVKQKHQVTIPLEIRKKINLHEGDTLEAKEQDGVIILTPQILTSRSREAVKKKQSSLLSLMGVNKDSGLYKNAKDADNYINNLRNEWN